VPDEPARGRKPVLRDELAAVVVKQQYPPERLPAFAAVPDRLWWVRLLLLVVGVGVTVHILRIKTRSDTGLQRKRVQAARQDAKSLYNSSAEAGQADGAPPLKRPRSRA
ncbi:MAG: hypothetical protein JXA30_18250, partial [Deltaproteobacteria bacterium]|nr:hypothetical protein [Deltaproteobacteria bacterium]